MRRILLIGGDADYNVGDAAIRHAVCAQLVRHDPDVRITIVSARSDDLRSMPGVVAVLPRGARAALAQWRDARAKDLVVIAGGGLFQDDDSRVKMPYWGARVAALRLACPVVGHSLGAGPLDHMESQWFARAACAAMRDVTVRDEFARQALQPHCARPLQIVPDPAFMLEPHPEPQAREWLSALGVTRGRPLLGVTIRGWFHARGGFVPHRVRARLGLASETGWENMTAMIANLAPIIANLATQLDAEVLLLPSYLAAHEGDERACASLAAALGPLRVHTARIPDPCLYKAVAGKLSLLVSARMHPLILAAGMGVPIVGLGYNGKFAGCMQALGASTQLMWLEQLVNPAAAATLERCASIALASADRTGTRAAELAERSRKAAARLLDLAA